MCSSDLTRVGRQIRDIPVDFTNAQAGIQRLDPVTNQPTIGARLQGAAQDVGRVVEQRRMAGESPIPGVPNVLTPETSLYAVRPEDTRLVMPQNLPEGTSASSLPISTATLTAIEDTVGEIGAKMTPEDALRRLQIQLHSMPHASIAAFEDFEKRKAMALYPDAPRPLDAAQAMYAAIPEKDHDAARLKLFDEFRETPEGIAAGYNQIPSSTELYQRDEAARNWLYGPFINYFKKDRKSTRLNSSH